MIHFRAVLVRRQAVLEGELGPGRVGDSACRGRRSTRPVGRRPWCRPAPASGPTASSGRVVPFFVAPQLELRRLGDLLAERQPPKVLQHLESLPADASPSGKSNLVTDFGIGTTSSSAFNAARKRGSLCNPAFSKYSRARVERTNAPQMGPLGTARRSCPSSRPPAPGCPSPPARRCPTAPSSPRPSPPSDPRLPSPRRAPTADDASEPTSAAWAFPAARASGARTKRH